MVKTKPYISVDLLEEIKKEREKELQTYLGEIIKLENKTTYQDYIPDELAEALGIEVVSNYYNERIKNLEKFVNEIETGESVSLNSIKNIAHKYALRFLPANRFKSEYPVQAVHNAKEWYDRGYNDFYILAPGKDLTLKKDPILFVKIDGRYTVVHKWGNDFTVFRRLLAWKPFSIIVTSLIGVLCYYLAILSYSNIDASFIGIVSLAGMIVSILAGILFIGSTICGETLFYDKKKWNSVFE